MSLFQADKRFAHMLKFSLEPRFVIVMPFYESGTVAQQIYRTNPRWLLTDDEYYHSGFILAMACDLIDVIQVIHEQGLVHYDIKPANLLLEYRQSRLHAVLCDFGIAQILESPLNHANVINAHPASKLV